MEEHIRATHKSYSVRCNLCGYMFNSMDSAKVHMVRSHNQELTHSEFLTLVTKILPNSYTCSSKEAKMN